MFRKLPGLFTCTANKACRQFKICVVAQLAFSDGAKIARQVEALCGADFSRNERIQGARMSLGVIRRDRVAIFQSRDDAQEPLKGRKVGSAATCHSGLRSR